MKKFGLEAAWTVVFCRRLNMKIPMQVLNAIELQSLFKLLNSSQILQFKNVKKQLHKVLKISLAVCKPSVKLSRS